MTEAPAMFSVMEQFYTIQGEGYNTGKAAYFIRLAGCDVGCVWCDVKESWDADLHPVLTIDALLSNIQKHPAKNVVITGGEPAMYDLTLLTNALHENGYNIWIETSGAHTLKGYFDWICLSPKKFKAPLQENLEAADELKVVVFNRSDLEWAEKNAALTKNGCRLYLQPEHGKFETSTPLIIDYVKQHPQWQISLQTHKIIQVP